MPDLSVALERAGYRTTLRADVASALEEPTSTVTKSVVLVDTKLLQTAASLDTGQGLGSGDALGSVDAV